MTPRRRACYVGKIGPPDRMIGGGGEIANRKAVGLLQDLGWSVREANNPYVRACGPRRAAAVARNWLRVWWTLGSWLLTRARRGSVVVIGGLYGNQIPCERVAVAMAGLRGIPVLYWLKAGMAQSSYRSRGPLYRRLFAGVARRCRTVAVEGRRDQAFLRRLGARCVTWFPNFLDLEAGTDDAPSRDGLVAIYCGRVVAAKGADTVIDCATALRGSGVRIRMIGPCTDADRRRFRQLIAERDLDGTLSIEAAMPRTALMSELRRSDVFLFPSRDPFEGHSNALTEAMGVGAIPVASDAGFTRDVVGDAGVVIPRSAAGVAYADAIGRIAADPDRRLRLRSAAADRVAERFSTAAARRRLARLLDDLTGREQ